MSVEAGLQEQAIFELFVVYDGVAVDVRVSGMTIERGLIYGGDLGR